MVNGEKMTYVHDKKKNGEKVNLDKGFGITKEDKNKAVATDFIIDTNKRGVGKGKINKSEPKMTE